ncbi:MAG: hypothetical protein RL215_1161 [Planctomycetota bacterium]
MFPGGIGRVPRAVIGENAEAKCAWEVLVEVDEECGIVPGFVGDLERIAVAGFQVFVGREAEPEGHGSGPVLGTIGGIDSAEHRDLGSAAVAKPQSGAMASGSGDELNVLALVARYDGLAFERVCGTELSVGADDGIEGVVEGSEEHEAGAEVISEGAAGMGCAQGGEEAGDERDCEFH